VNIEGEREGRIHKHLLSHALKVEKKGKKKSGYKKNRPQKH